MELDPATKGFTLPLCPKRNLTKKVHFYQNVVNLSHLWVQEVREEETSCGWLWH
jgi:hypothetical protein